MKPDEPTMNDWLFIGEYVKDWNGTAAMKRAGFYHGKFASDEAVRRLAKPAVKREINNLRAHIIGTVQLSTKSVVDDILNVLSADPRELIETRVESCRYCHGVDHLYQFTLNEWRRAEFEAQCKGKMADQKGGINFNPYADPHPDCPECHGRGLIIESLKDTRFLSPGALALFAGVERTKSGLKINMRSKDSARDAAAKFLGMNKETVRILDGKDMKEATDEELEAIARGEKK